MIDPTTVTPGVLSVGVAPPKLVETALDCGLDLDLQKRMETIAQALDETLKTFGAAPGIGKKLIQTEAIQDELSEDGERFRYDYDDIDCLVDRHFLVVNWSSCAAPVALNPSGMGDLSMPMTADDLADGLAILAFVPEASWYESEICPNTGKEIKVYSNVVDPFAETRMYVTQEKDYELQTIPYELKSAQAVLA